MIQQVRRLASITVVLLVSSLAAALAAEAAQEIPAGHGDAPAARIWAHAELFGASPSQLRQSLMPQFTGEIDDIDWRNIHPSPWNWALVLYEPAEPISPSACRRITHHFWFRESRGDSSGPGTIVHRSWSEGGPAYSGALYLPAENGVCSMPVGGGKGFDARQVDVSEVIAKYQQLIASQAVQATCDQSNIECATLFKVIPLASLRSLSGCYETDCVAEFMFPDPETGRSRWGWNVKLFETGGGQRVDIRRALPPPVS